MLKSATTMLTALSLLVSLAQPCWHGAAADSTAAADLAASMAAAAWADSAASTVADWAADLAGARDPEASVAPADLAALAASAEPVDFAPVAPDWIARADSTVASIGPVVLTPAGSTGARAAWAILIVERDSTRQAAMAWPAIAGSASTRTCPATSASATPAPRLSAGRHTPRTPGRTTPCSDRGNTVRNNFWNHNYFNRNWWHDHPGAGSRPVGEWAPPGPGRPGRHWVAGTAGATTSHPIYYDYGTNVTYDDNEVYYGDQPDRHGRRVLRSGRNDRQQRQQHQRQRKANGSRWACSAWCKASKPAPAPCFNWPPTRTARSPATSATCCRGNTLQVHGLGRQENATGRLDRGRQQGHGLRSRHLQPDAGRSAGAGPLRQGSHAAVDAGAAQAARPGPAAAGCPDAAQQQ